ncbi:hypothetical protein LA345_20710 [Burkholderia vietnamiensis]|uniref:Multi-ubiquitin domain-containing protein n=1 Tax=Burkholderia vietnamiensis (strain G4 / LMG 22486) TaxID=269482 RepID=A4JAI1_BURVG|nr:hypothetical protein [Burkholderia vietnamiensis]ABO53284.1 hypothetical protein Bcep1808_0270 [Burkholderia vietnamiensis G4]MCB4346320.1 hypothetical protein [Burkholderia vietnamiensis]
MRDANFDEQADRQAAPDGGHGGNPLAPNSLGSDLAQALRKVEEAEGEIAKGEADLDEAIHELEELEHSHPVRIVVNTKQVEMPHNRASGLAIKERAIAVGVNIKLDFVLFAELGDGRQEVVKDDQIIHLHSEQRFEAIDNDDHS